MPPLGVLILLTQVNGVTTAFSTITDIFWQPGKFANVRVGHFLAESNWTAGNTPVHSDYVVVDLTMITPTGNIPLQLYDQLVASGALLDGGTITYT
jgi:hypothetical protein